LKNGNTTVFFKNFDLEGGLGEEFRSNNGEWWKTSSSGASNNRWRHKL